MGSKEERLGGSHLPNQRSIKLGRDRRPKGFGPMDKVVEAASRKERIERSKIEFEEMLVSLEEQQRGLTEGGNQVPITIVDFTRIDVLSKEEVFDRVNPLEQERTVG